MPLLSRSTKDESRGTRKTNAVNTISQNLPRSLHAYSRLKKILPISIATIAKRCVFLFFFSFEQENSTTKFINASWLQASTTFASTLRSSSLAVSLSIHARRAWQLLSIREFKTAPHHLVHLSLYTGQAVLGHDGSLCYKEKNDWVTFASPKRIIARGARHRRCAAWILAQ